MIEIKYLIHSNKNKLQIYIINKNKKYGYICARMFPLVIHNNDSMRNKNK